MAVILEFLSFLPGLDEEEDIIKKWIIFGIYVFMILFWIISTIVIFVMINNSITQINKMKLMKSKMIQEQRNIELLKKREIVGDPGLDFLLKEGVSRKMGKISKLKNTILPSTIYPTEKVFLYNYSVSKPFRYHFPESKAELVIKQNSIKDIINAEKTLDRNIYYNKFDDFKKYNAKNDLVPESDKKIFYQKFFFKKDSFYDKLSYGENIGGKSDD